jgi:hypothetical protein
MNYWTCVSFNFWLNKKKNKKKSLLILEFKIEIKKPKRGDIHSNTHTDRHK